MQVRNKIRMIIKCSVTKETCARCFKLYIVVHVCAFRVPLVQGAHVYMLGKNSGMVMVN